MRELTRLDRMRIAGSASISLFVGTESYNRGYTRHSGVCDSINQRYKDREKMPMRAHVANVYDGMQGVLDKARAAKPTEDALLLYPAQPGEFGFVVGLDEGQLARHAIYVVRHNGVEIPVFIDCFPPKQEVELPKGGVIVVDHGHADDMPGKSAKWLGASNYIISPRVATSLLSDPFTIAKANIHIIGEDHDSDRYVVKAVEKTRFNGKDYQKGEDILVDPMQDICSVEMQNLSTDLQDLGVTIATRNFKISHGFPEDNNGLIITVYKGRDPVKRIINIGDGTLAHPTVVTKTNPLENLRYALSTMEPGIPAVVLITSGHTGYLERKTEPNHGILGEHKIQPLLKTLDETGFLGNVSDIYVTSRHLENLAIPGQMVIDEAERLSREWAEKRKQDDIHPHLVEVWEAACKDPGVIRAAVQDLYDELGVSLDRPIEDIRTTDAKNAARAYEKELIVITTPTVVSGNQKFEDGRDPFVHVM